MKLKFTALLLAFTFLKTFSQTIYPSYNFTLVSHLNPQTNTGGDGRKYSGCWGWRQDSTGREYALVGTADKTYFIDVTNPAAPSIRDSVQARRSGCTWREIKNYKHYAYIVSDDAKPNSFQIVDMRYLPDSVHVVYDDTTLFERGHTCWVDGNKLYVGGVTPSFGGTINMRVYSLANPQLPVLLRTLSDDFPVINYVHDMFVRNDTVYASAGGQGLHVFKYNPGPNNFTSLGSLTGYSGAGYNHSSYITDNGKTLVFCDEVPTGLSIKVANVSNLGNISLDATTKPNSNPDFVAHNPYVLGNKWAFVSCYQDGLLLYDISTPSNPILKGFFDTHPQGGSNLGNNYFGQSYRGNWGAYPYFPSGTILACDMQNGIFLLSAKSLISVGVNENENQNLSASIYPNPANTDISITFIPDNSSTCTFIVTDITGRTILNEERKINLSSPLAQEKINVREFESGAYLVKVISGNKSIQKKIIITH